VVDRKDRVTVDGNHFKITEPLTDPLTNSQLIERDMGGVKLNGAKGRAESTGRSLFQCAPASVDSCRWCFVCTVGVDPVTVGRLAGPKTG
jgi:hypothetical protein